MARVKRGWVVGAVLWVVCLTLTGNIHVTQAAIYRHPGLCIYKESLFEPGQTFYRGCDKCYCHEKGVTCFPPMKPTSWPNKCQRVPTECGYRVVYRENPELECRAYSWIW